MKKKIFISIIAVLLIACVSVTFSIWLGDVNKSKDFTINSTTDFLFLSSGDLAIDGSNDTITPDNSVKHKFNLKIKGKACKIVLTYENLNYSSDGGINYKPVTPGILDVLFESNNVNVEASLTTYQTIELKSEIKFVANIDDIDPVYENALFKYTVKVTVNPYGI